MKISCKLFQKISVFAYGFILTIVIFENFDFTRQRSEGVMESLITTLLQIVHKMCQ